MKKKYLLSRIAELEAEVFMLRGQVKALENLVRPIETTTPYIPWVTWETTNPTQYSVEPNVTKSVPVFPDTYYVMGNGFSKGVFTQPVSIMTVGENPATYCTTGNTH